MTPGGAAGVLAALTCTLPVPASAMHMCQGLWVVCTLVVNLVGRSWKVKYTVNVLLFWSGGHFAGFCYLVQISEWMNK